MVDAGKIGPADKEGTLEHAVQTGGKYPFLIDEAGKWTQRKDVRNVRMMASGTGPMKVHNNEWLTISGRTIGPEIGLGTTWGSSPTRRC